MRTAIAWDERLALLLSVVLHPFVITVVTVPVVIAFTEPSLTDALWWTGLYLGLVIVPVLVLLLYKVRTRRVSDMDVTVREQRLVFFALGCSGFLVLLVLMQVGDAPPALMACVYAAIATLVTAAVINHFVTKVSVHAAAMAGCAAVLIAVAPWFVDVLMAISTLLLGWARVRLTRHTGGQVLLGWGVAVACVGIIFWWML